MNVPEYWWPFIYQYGVGLLIFCIGLFLIIRFKACDLSRRDHRFWLGVLIGGFLWYAGMHFFWYMAALYIMPASGGGAG